MASVEKLREQVVELVERMKGHEAKVALWLAGMRNPLSAQGAAKVVLERWQPEWEKLLGLVEEVEGKKRSLNDELVEVEANKKSLDAEMAEVQQQKEGFAAREDMLSRREGVTDQGNRDLDTRQAGLEGEVKQRKLMATSLVMARGETFLQAFEDGVKARVKLAEKTAHGAEARVERLEKEVEGLKGEKKDLTEELDKLKKEIPVLVANQANQWVMEEMEEREKELVIAHEAETKAIREEAKEKCLETSRRCVELLKENRMDREAVVAIGGKMDELSQQMIMSDGQQRETAKGLGEKMTWSTNALVGVESKLEEQREIGEKVGDLTLQMGSLSIAGRSRARRADRKMIWVQNALVGTLAGLQNQSNALTTIDGMQRTLDTKQDDILKDVGMVNEKMKDALDEQEVQGGRMTEIVQNVQYMLTSTGSFETDVVATRGLQNVMSMRLVDVEATVDKTEERSKSQSRMLLAMAKAAGAEFKFLAEGRKKMEKLLNGVAIEVGKAAEGGRKVDDMALKIRALTEKVESLRGPQKRVIQQVTDQPRKVRIVEVPEAESNGDEEEEEETPERGEPTRPTGSNGSPARGEDAVDEWQGVDAALADVCKQVTWDGQWSQQKKLQLCKELQDFRSDDWAQSFERAAGKSREACLKAVISGSKGGIFYEGRGVCKGHKRLGGMCVGIRKGADGSYVLKEHE